MLPWPLPVPPRRACSPRAATSIHFPRVLPRSAFPLPAIFFPETGLHQGATVSAQPRRVNAVESVHALPDLSPETAHLMRWDGLPHGLQRSPPPSPPGMEPATPRNGLPPTEDDRR